jgi:hypothetical protein
MDLSTPRLKLHRFAYWLVALCLWLTSHFAAFGQVQVLTEHNDSFRSGANTSETLLAPRNVNSTFFGKLFTDSVDGFIVGQPLYLPAIQLPDGTIHNVVYVATQHDSVFAFDADSAQPPLWAISFINPSAGITSVPISDFGCAGTGYTEIGIMSTPVIDTPTGAIYLVAKTLENGAFVYRLHALSLTTGQDITPAAVITASATTSSGALQFDSSIQMQRPALLLSTGSIYVGFGSNGCDTYSYHGWLLAYDKVSLAQVGTFVTTPNGAKGAIWQAGGGPAADTDGTVFLATGNGTFDANTGGTDYGDSLIHLSSAGDGLTLLDYFTPYNQQTLAAGDVDLGSGGVTLLPDQDVPHTHELLGGGKEGSLYLVDRDNMGGFNPTGDTEIVESIPQASAGELVSVPAYWNGNVYISGQSDFVKAFSLTNGLLSTQPASQTSVLGISPGSVSISSNGSNNGILWGIPLNNPATLGAFDAQNLSTVLYTSAQAAGLRDQLGIVPKFVAPTIANGKVYVGGTSSLTVFGLLPLISSVAGNNQSAYVGTTLPVQLQLETVDAYHGNPIANASVTCKDGGVGGTFSAVMPMVTDSQGQASTAYTLPKKSQTITITCTSNGYVAGSFLELANAGPVTRELIVSGNNQTGAVSAQLPSALVMQVLDPYSFGVPGVSVMFDDGGAGGIFSPSSVLTDSVGKATTFYTTPVNTGKVTITASTTGLTPVMFSEVVTATGANFALSAAPNALDVVQGGSRVPTTITVNPSGGFTDSVTLASSGLPSGVSASFNPSSTTGTSTLTLTANSSATTGPATVTVTGTSGSLTQTTTISLTVNPPASYTLSAGTPSPTSVSPGDTSTTRIAVTSLNGYASSVKLVCNVSPIVNPAATCSIEGTNPVVVTTAGGSATLVFTAVGPSAALIRHSVRSLAGLWLPVPVLVLLGLGTGSRPSLRKRFFGFAVFWMMLATIIILPACGGSPSSGGGGGGGGNGGTPAGTYQVTIAGQDANNQSQSNAAPVVSITVD